MAESNVVTVKLHPDTIRRLDRLTKAVEKISAEKKYEIYNTVSPKNSNESDGYWCYDAPGTVGHREETLFKVKEVLENSSIAVDISMVIGNLQDAGILFRERVD